MNSYKIIKELNLIVQYLSGNVSISVVKEHMRNLSLEPDYSKYYDTIIDLRDSNFNIIIDDVAEFADFVSFELEVIGNRKTVYLTNKPNEVVLTTLLSKTLKNTEIDFLICSTEEAAIKFLNKEGLNKEILDVLIREIKTTQPNKVRL